MSCHAGIITVADGADRRGPSATSRSRSVLFDLAADGSSACRSSPAHFVIKSFPLLLLRFSDRAREKPNVDSLERFPAAPPSTGANPENRQRAALAVADHRAPSAPHEEHASSQSQSGPRSKTSSLENPLPSPRCPEVGSHEAPPDPQSDTFFASPASTFASTHPGPGESEQVNRVVVRGQGAVQHPTASNKQPASPSPPLPLPLPPPPPPPPSAHTAMEGQRSPSPHFSPQRLSDKPPVAANHEETNR